MFEQPNPIEYLAQQIEDWGNDLIGKFKFVMLNGWNGNINSMTYALQSSGELRRGTICRDDNAIEHVHTLWWNLEYELESCVDIALEASNANYENELDIHDDNYDPAGDDYDQLDELLTQTRKVVKRLDMYRELFAELEG